MAEGKSGATSEEQEILSALKVHYAEKVLPMWRAAGFNVELGLAYEAVSSQTTEPLAPTRYRAMACARQLFVFALAGKLDHAKLLFNSLKIRFQDKEHGGWFFSVDARGHTGERKKDLYTHAFIVFAAAEYARLSGNKEALQIVDETSDLILERFSVAGGAPGLLNAVMSADFSEAIEGAAQNPLMHLTEAWLAARAASGDTRYDERLDVLIRAVAGHFTHEATGCILELPEGTEGNRIEPGHQFEWYFLAYGSAHTAFDAAGMRASLARAFDFACRHGVDPVTAGVCAAVDESGQVLDPTQRIWAQTEFLRALATHVSSDVKAHLPQVASRFKTRFLHDRGWFECLTADGVVSRSDMPSTTPYHLATALLAMP
ncbi:mannose-6-phosphate isomerase [Paraburkholderia silvatlantica]|nr:AGE family epimerase/isomerase [Paraburkholderia silvatlantica]PVY21449.1 mannose-6-phosphate isomerase [Paraburkholderia silvatlantica]PXW26046.1 mannose-6-phosphate isomerase [Paraburkholderia silvatlantica]